MTLIDWIPGYLPHDYLPSTIRLILHPQHKFIKEEVVEDQQWWKGRDARDGPEKIKKEDSRLVTQGWTGS